MQQDPSRGVRVPPELHGVQPRPLEVGGPPHVMLQSSC